MSIKIDRTRYCRTLGFLCFMTGLALLSWQAALMAFGLLLVYSTIQIPRKCGRATVDDVLADYAKQTANRN